MLFDQRFLEQFCHKHQINKLSLYGSMQHGTNQADSDVDLLVEFIPGKEPSLFEIARMENELKQTLDREIDLRTPEDLSIYFRDEVMQSAEVQFEQK